MASAPPTGPTAGRRAASGSPSVTEPSARSSTPAPTSRRSATYLKFRRALSDGRVFDAPPQTTQRCLVEKVDAPFVIGRADHRRLAIPAGKTLRIDVHEPAVVRWDADGGVGGEVPTRDTGLGVHVTDLFIVGLPSGRAIHFTLFWTESGWWDQRNVEGIQSDRVRVE